jgi:hypothetical protein
VKLSGALSEAAETKIPLSGSRPGCNATPHIVAPDFEKNVPEKAGLEPETNRQKRAAFLDDPKSSLRYLSL